MALGYKMKLRIKKYEIVNGFKVIRDEGRIGKKRPGSAVCKICNNEFDCDIYQLRYRKGCGCIKPNPMPKMNSFINGFAVIQDLGRINGNRRVKVKCKVCEKELEGQVQNLKTAKSCGCLKAKEIICSYKHTQPRIYRIYKNMLNRCYDNKHKSSHNYGSRGINVCGLWVNNADSFCEWALKNGYEDSLTLDRINGSMGYAPNNCRWTTVTEQNRNARSNVLCIEIVKMIRGEDRAIMTTQQIADKYGLARTTVSGVLNFYSWNNI